MLASSSGKCQKACFTRAGCIMPNAISHRGPGRPPRYPKCTMHNRPIHKWNDGTSTAPKPKYNNASRAVACSKNARDVPDDEDEDGDDNSLPNVGAARAGKRAKEEETAGEPSEESRAKKAKSVSKVDEGLNQSIVSASEPASQFPGAAQHDCLACPGREKPEEMGSGQPELADHFYPKDLFKPFEILFDIGEAAMAKLKVFIEAEELAHTDMTSYRDFLEILETNQELRENYKDLCRRHMAIGPLPFGSSTFWQEFQVIKFRALESKSTRLYRADDPRRWNLEGTYSPSSHLLLTLLGVCT